MSSKIIYPVFFLSGTAGLIYEIVWGRLLVLIFGSTTNSIVAVICAFLGGLALGSLIFGRIADKLSPPKLIKTYATLEFCVGASAIATLVLNPFTRSVYGSFSDGSQVTLSVMIIKFLVSILILIVPTILMGATLPVLVRFLETQKTNPTKGVSLLYAVNTFGAVIGVLLSAFIFIELFGLRNTILIAAAINFSIAFFARFIKFKDSNKVQKVDLEISLWQLFTKKNTTVIIAFFLSGLISIAYEVLWTRILTPTVGTFIYAFAAILAIYLFGIALGSLIYQKFSKVIKNKSLAFATCELAIGFFALGSIFLTSNQVAIGRNLLVLGVILPATFFMGLTFPAVISLLESKHTGKIVGLSYFANTIGSIIGAFLVSFFFLPKIGSSQSVLLLSIFNFAIAAVFIFQSNIKLSLKFSASLIVLLLFLFSTWLFLAKRNSLYENTTQWRINWAKQKNIDYIFKEDEIASTFGYNDTKNNDQNLFIDGVPTTGKVGETKLMAHIPILLHNNPQDVLVIAFGMGSTFKSSLSYDIRTDVVELVPSVPKMLQLFQKDADEVLKNPKGKIIINDGRNYIFLTRKKYDIVTIDPPPPFNAAGTTVLYSENFYKDIAKKLNSGGIVSQWMWFGSRQDDIAMATKSFTNVFPYVLVFQNHEGFGGLFLEGSFSPFTLNKEAYQKKISLVGPNKDLSEFYKDKLKLSQVLDFLIGDRESLLKKIDNYPAVTDDHPKTEYFMLRHAFTQSQDLVGLSGANFIISIKSNPKPQLITD